MSMKKNKSPRLILSIFLAVLFALTTNQAAASAPLSIVKSSVDAIIAILKENGLDREQKRERIRSIVLERFDFIEMSKRILGPNWNTLSHGDQNAFVDRFKRLLEASYVNKIEAYTDEQVVFENEIIKGRYAKVESKAITKTADIPIDYVMIQKDGEWFVYDVIIENVSLISNYRSTYNEIIKKNGFAHLIEEMDSKIQELSNSPNPKG